MSAPITMGSIAVAMARTGLHVFPVRAGSKEPATRRGFKAATTDVDRITKWWNANPHFNIGIATGLSGLVVIDCDRGKPWPTGGKWAPEPPPQVDDGTDVLALFSEHDGIDPVSWLFSVPSVVTPSGGTHWYYRAPAGVTVKSSAGQLGPWLDVRADGGYVVAPWSSTPDGVYKPVNGWDHVVEVDTIDLTTPIGLPELTELRFDPPLLPDWLRARVKTSATTSAKLATFAKVAADNVSSDPLAMVSERLNRPGIAGDSGRYVSAVLDGESDKVRRAGEGVRNHTLNDAAFRLGTLGGAGLLDEATATQELLSAARMCGLDDSEALTTIKSGWRAGLRNPRKVDLP